MKSQHRPYLIANDELQVIEEELRNCKDYYQTIEDLSIFIMLSLGKYPSKKKIKSIVLERIKSSKLFPAKGIEYQRYTAQLEDISDCFIGI